VRRTQQIATQAQNSAETTATSIIPDTREEKESAAARQAVAHQNIRRPVPSGIHIADELGYYSQNRQELTVLTITDQKSTYRYQSQQRSASSTPDSVS
jgi:hypothetical protein